MEKQHHFGRGKTQYELETGHQGCFYRNLLVSFVIMLIIPVIMATVNYFWSGNSLEKEIVKYNQALLDQTQNILDERLQNIQLYCFGMSENQTLTSFLKSTDLEKGDLYVEINHVQAILGNFESLYDGVTAVIYSVHYEDAIASETVIYGVGPEAVAQILFGDEETYSLPSAQVTQILNEADFYSHYQCFFLDETENGNGEGRIFLLQSLPLWSSRLSYNGFLVVEVDVTSLLGEVGALLPDESGALGIIDREGNIVSGIGERDLLATGYESVVADGANSFRMDGMRYFVNSQQSVINGWTYVLVQSDADYLAQLRTDRTFIYLMLIILLIVGMVMALWLSGYNYRPVNRIVRRLRNSGNAQEMGDRDEFSYIEAVLDQMLQSEDEKETLAKLDGHGGEQDETVYNEEFETVIGPYLRIDDIREQIKSAIMSGNGDLTLQLLDESYHANFDARDVDHAVAVGYFSMMLNIILNCYFGSEEEKRKLWDSYNPMKGILSADTTENMQLIVRGFALVIIHRVKTKRANYADSVMQRIIAYIDDNLGNTDLSLSSVAEHFGITPNYLSGFFRERTGETFINYLTGQRIAMAKELMKNTDFSVNEIALKVGYASSNSFIRAFKKTENMTPGDYIKSVR